MIYQLSRKLYDFILLEACNRQAIDYRKYKSLSNEQKVLLYINEHFLNAPHTLNFNITKKRNRFTPGYNIRRAIWYVTSLRIID